MIRWNLSVTAAVLFLAVNLAPALSFAAVGLSVIPADGSSSLKLEQAYLGLDNKKDVRIRVTSTDGKRYQVFARVLEPIVNEKGETLELNAVSLATVPNSNTSGTLYLQTEDRLSMGEQLLYSSSQNGDSDAFIISYVLNPDQMRSSGNFIGRIVYTVRSSEGGDSQSSLTVNVQANSQFKINISGSRAPDRIGIDDTNVTEQNADYVKISFSGNSGQNVRIYQEPIVMPQSSEGADLGPEGLMFYATGLGDGVKAQALSMLNPNRSLIYQGQDNGGNILVYYQLNPQRLAEQAPGLYSGRLRFTVESDQGVQDYFIDIKCTIQPVFTIDVKVPPEGISFNRVVANDPAQEKEVVITVHSNLRKPYQVTQNFQSLMTNERGQELNKEYFTQRIELGPGSRGKTRFNDFTPVDSGEIPVFVSDSKGNPVVFKIIFKLQGYQGMSPGAFNAPVQFSLNQN